MGPLSVSPPLELRERFLLSDGESSLLLDLTVSPAQMPGIRSPKRQVVTRFPFIAV